MLWCVVGLRHIPSGSQLVTTMELYSPGLERIRICERARRCEFRTVKKTRLQGGISVRKYAVNPLMMQELIVQLNYYPPEQTACYLIM